MSTHLRMKHLFTLLLILSGSFLFAQADSTEIDTTISDNQNTEFEKAKRVFVEVGYGYGMCHYKVIGDTYPALIACRSEHETPINVPMSDLRVGYQIKEWWSLGAGIQYFQTGFDFSEEKTLSDTLPMEFVIGCEVYNVVDPEFGYVYNGFFDPRFASGILGYHPDEATLNNKPRYHYLGLPIKTELSGYLNFLRFRSLGVFINAGLTPNYMIKQNYYQSYENASWTYVLQDSTGVPSSYIRRWNMSAEFGLGVKFISVKRFEARVEYHNQYQLFYLFDQKRYTKEDYQERHSISMVNISLRYYLGKK